MEWLIALSERYRERIRSGPFFPTLNDVREPRDLKWIYQLIHQSREFTQALGLRSSLCKDPAYRPIFNEHTREEIDHPDQLQFWMDHYGFVGVVPPTFETINSLSFCSRSAWRDPPDVQVVALNLLSEGVALDFYTAVIPVLERFDILSGRYWKVHRDVDARHLRLGLDLCGDVAPDSETGLVYQRVLWHSATLYHQMLASWVGAQAEQLAMLPASSGDGVVSVPAALLDSDRHYLNPNGPQS